MKKDQIIQKFKDLGFEQTPDDPLVWFISNRLKII